MFAEIFSQNYRIITIASVILPFIIVYIIATKYNLKRQTSGVLLVSVLMGEFFALFYFTDNGSIYPDEIFREFGIYLDNHLLFGLSVITIIIVIIFIIHITLSSKKIGSVLDPLIPFNFFKQKSNLEAITIEDIDKMSGKDFELYLKKLFQKMGYSVVLTPDTNDMGADLILSKSGQKISVQAKNWINNVGNSAIQEVVGSLNFYKTQRGMVITSSDFSSQAITLAYHNHVELWNREKLIEIIKKYPVNK